MVSTLPPTSLHPFCPQAHSQSPAHLQHLQQVYSLRLPPCLFSSFRSLFLPRSHTPHSTNPLLLENLRVAQGSSHLCACFPSAGRPGGRPPPVCRYRTDRKGRAGRWQPESGTRDLGTVRSPAQRRQGMGMRTEMRHPPCLSVASGMLAVRSGPLPAGPSAAASASSRPPPAEMLLQAGGWALLPASGGAAPPARSCPPLSSPPAAFMSVFKRRRSEGWAHVAATACPPLSPAPAPPRSPSAPLGAPGPPFRQLAPGGWR